MRPILALLVVVALSGCYNLRYRIEAVVSGLTFPTGVAFDEQGTAYDVEAG
jgi:hypothetical protein